MKFGTNAANGDMLWVYQDSLLNQRKDDLP